MSDPHLHQLLERASDLPPRPDLAPTAVRRARTRQRRRTVGTAAAATLAVVVTTVGVGTVMDGAQRPDAPPAAPAVSAPSWVPEDAVAPPFSVDDLPQDDSLLLPTDLTPTPDGAVDAPALAVVQLPGEPVTAWTDDGWRSSESTDRLWRGSLAADGAYLALEADGSFELSRLGTGVGALVPNATGGAALLWGPRHELLQDVPGPGGEATRVPPRAERPVTFPDTEVGVGPESVDVADATVASDGDIVTVGDGVHSRWTTPDQVDEVASAPDGLGAPVATGDRVAALLDDPEGSTRGVAVFDGWTEAAAYLPVPEGSEVDLLTWLDEQRVLAQVDTAVVVWDTESGAVSRAASLPEGAGISVAAGSRLLR